MTPIHSKRRRSLAFDALEGRLTLSAGMGMAAVAHHAPTAHVSAAQTSLKASFKGHGHLSTTGFTITGLNGKIGPDRFTGSATGTQSANQFQGGTVSLSNNKGTVIFDLVETGTKKVGKSIKPIISLVATGATGKYAPFLGATGNITSWNIPAKLNAPASFGASIHV